MTYNELARALSDNGLDIVLDRYELGLDYWGSGERFICNTEKNVYEHYEGEKENELLVEGYKSEEECVAAMATRMYQYSFSFPNLKGVSRRVFR